MKIAVLAVSSRSGETGGAERFYQGLTRALNSAGIKADLIEHESDESSFDCIKETYLKFYDLDVSSYDGVISTKAPSYLVRHHNHVCYLVHTMRVFYDMFEREFRSPAPEELEQRKFIIALDRAALGAGRIKKIFSIGHEIAERLRVFNGLESEVLHPALLFDNFNDGTFEDYLFLPGRLHRWKRVDLVVRAMAHVKSPVTLKIAGTGEDEANLRSLAGHNPRIEFLGRVTDDELAALYANALAVPFVPEREDYGYVTLEAFKSKKPVITCSDSGEPAHFVRNQVNGFVCEPDPREIAERADFLFHRRDNAAAMGLKGYESIAHISWERIVHELINALGMSDAG
jgi:glycosyltransferase involved in cell wall biosynthesis